MGQPAMLGGIVGRYWIGGNLGGKYWIEIQDNRKEPTYRETSRALAYAVSANVHNYPVPTIRHDICYWNCGGVSISVPGEIEARYTFGRAFGNGIRLNSWEP